MDMATATFTRSIRAIKLVAISLIICTALHFAAHQWVALEQRLNAGVQEAQAEVVAAIATRHGYELPIAELPELSPLEIAEREALRHKINPAVVRSLLRHESAENQFALSNKGAVGLMQVMPFNAKRCGMKPAELIDAEKNIKCGVKLFAEDLKATGGDLSNALRRYNGGPNCVKYICRESEEHQRKVLALLARDIRG